MGVLNKGTDFSNGDQVTDTNLDNLVDNATFTSSAVDGSTTDISGAGAIIVRDGGITGSKLATGALNDSEVTATGSTSARSLSDRFAEVVNVKDFGATGDGVTDDTAAIRAAKLATPTGGVIYFPEGTYRAIGSNVLSSLSNIRVTGAGRQGSKILFEEETSGVAIAPITISGDNVIFEDIGFQCISTSIDSLIVKCISASNKVMFSGVEVDGSLSFDGVDRNRVHFIKINDNVDTAKWTIANCYIHDVHFGVFTSNSLTALQQQWSIDGNHFWNNTGDDLEFNSADNPNRVWVDITVTGNTFVDNSYSTDPSFAIGSDSGKEITIVGNTFRKYLATSAIHLEDNVENVTISGNVFYECRFGIELYDNSDSNHYVISGNVFNGANGFSEDIDPSTMADPDVLILNNSVAILAQRRTAGTNKNCLITGNQINNYDVAIGCPQGGSVVVINNKVALCKLAYSSLEPGEVQFSNNTASKCKYLFNGSDNATIIESVSVNDTPNILFNTSGSFIIRDEFKIYLLSPSIPDNLVSSVDMFEMPDLFYLKSCTGTAYHEGGVFSVALAGFDSDYDGTTLNAARLFSNSSGPLSFGNPVLSDNAGKLAVELYQNSGSSKTHEVSLCLKGLMKFS
jgi:parallel beta-helix repeat protein